MCEVESASCTHCTPRLGWCVAPAGGMGDKQLLAEGFVRRPDLLWGAGEGGVKKHFVFSVSTS